MSEPGLEFGASFEPQGHDTLDKIEETLRPLLSEVQTVGQYRQRRLELELALENSFDKALIGNELWQVHLSVPAISVIDHAQGIEEYTVADKPVKGFVAGLFLLKNVGDEFFDQDAASDFEALSDDTPLSLSPGLRLVPLHIPEGFEPRATFYEIPFARIAYPEEIYDDHPLIEALNEFYQVCDETVRLQGLTDDTWEQLQQCVAEINRRSRVINLPMKLLFTPRTDYTAYVIGPAQCVPGLPAGEGGIIGELSCVASDFSLRRLGNEEGKSIATLSTRLWLLDNHDIAHYGGNVIEVNVQDIRSGTMQDAPQPLPHVSRASRMIDLFATESQLAEEQLLPLAATTLSKEAVKASIKELCYYYALHSRLVGATVLLTVTEDSYVEAQFDDGGTPRFDVCEVKRALPIFGTILYLSIGAAAAKSTETVDLKCILNTAHDTWYGHQLNVKNLMISRSLIATAQLLDNPNFN